MRKRSRLVSAVSLGLALICSGQAVVAAPASVTVAVTGEAAGQPEKTRNSGMSVAIWVAIGTAVFVAITAGQRRRNTKTESDKGA